MIELIIRPTIGSSCTQKCWDYVKAIGEFTENKKSFVSIIEYAVGLSELLKNIEADSVFVWRFRENDIAFWHIADKEKINDNLLPFFVIKSNFETFF